MRTATAFLAFMTLAGCCPQAQPAQVYAQTDQQLPTGCHYNYASPSRADGDDATCEVSTNTSSFLLEPTHAVGFQLVSTGLYHVTLTVLRDFDQASAISLDQPGAQLELAAFPCEHWAGIAAWVPGADSWSLEINATCQGGSALQVFYSHAQQ